MVGKPMMLFTYACTISDVFPCSDSRMAFALSNPSRFNGSPSMSARTFVTRSELCHCWQICHVYFRGKFVPEREQLFNGDTDTLIDGAVNEMSGRFVSCRPGFGRSDWLATPLGNPTHHRPKPHSCQVSRRTMTSKYSRKISINFNCICVKLICTEISEEVLNQKFITW